MNAEGEERDDEEEGCRTRLDLALVNRTAFAGVVDFQVRQDLKAGKQWHCGLFVTFSFERLQRQGVKIVAMPAFNLEAVARPRRRTAKDYNDQKKLQEIDARMRPVVPGEGKLKGMESPLYGEKLRGWVKENWDLEASVPNKVRQLLACLFYPMDPEGLERDGVPRMRRVCTALDRVAPLPKVVRRREDGTPD